MRSLKNKGESIFRSKSLVALYPNTQYCLPTRLSHVLSKLVRIHSFETNTPQKISRCCSSVYGEDHAYPIRVSISDYNSEVT